MRDPKPGDLFTTYIGDIWIVECFTGHNIVMVRCLSSANHPVSMPVGHTVSLNINNMKNDAQIIDADWRKPASSLSSAGIPGNSGIAPNVVGGSWQGNAPYGLDSDPPRAVINLDKVCPACAGAVEKKVFDSFSYNYCPRCREDTAHLAKRNRVQDEFNKIAKGVQ